MVRTNDGKINLGEAVKFHGHLGPYLVLGILAGRHALRKMKAKKYFGVEVKVWGVSKKPKSCFVDGLQLSTGATYGKGNIFKLGGKSIRLSVKNRITDSKISLGLTKQLNRELDKAKTHQESERLAKRIVKMPLRDLFSVVSSP